MEMEKYKEQHSRKHIRNELYSGKAGNKFRVKNVIGVDINVYGHADITIILEKKNRLCSPGATLLATCGLSMVCRH